MNKDGKRDYLALENYIEKTQLKNPECELSGQMMAEGLGWSKSKVSQNLTLSREKGRMIRRFIFITR